MSGTFHHRDCYIINVQYAVSAVSEISSSKGWVQCLANTAQQGSMS
jgi:hypothetical protein